MTNKPQHAGPDIRSRVLHGLAWVAGAQVALHVTRAVVAIAIARLLTPDEYGLAALAIVFSSLVMVFSDLALGAALIQRKTLRRRTRTRRSGSRSAAACSSPCSASSWPGRSPRSTASPTRSRCWWRSRRASSSPPLGATQLTLMMRVMDFRRSELLGLAGSRWRRRLRRGAGRPRRRRLGDRHAADRRDHADDALVWWRSEWYPRFMFSLASLRDLGSFSIYMLGQRIALLPAGERGPLPDRPLSRHHCAGYLCRGLQHHAGAGEQDRRPAPAGVLTGLLADPGRARADRRRVGARRAGASRLVAIPSLGGLVVVAPDFVPVVLGSSSGRTPYRSCRSSRGSASSRRFRPSTTTSSWRAAARGRCSASRSSRPRATSSPSVVGLQWGVVGVAVGYAISTTLVEPFRRSWPRAALAYRRWCSCERCPGSFRPPSRCARSSSPSAWRSRTPAWTRPCASRLHRCVGALVFVPLCLWRVPELASEVRRCCGAARCRPRRRRRARDGRALSARKT